VGKSTQFTYDAFVRSLASSERTRLRVEALLASGDLGIRDVERVYEALFIRSVVQFEAMLEEVFVGLISGRLKSPKTGISPRANFFSDGVLKDIIYGERDYLDWLPYNRTETLARRFLTAGRPFTDLDDGRKSEIKRIVLTRHSIAHKSEFSKRQFVEKVIASAVLLPHEKTPAGYLRSNFRTAPPQRRFELFSITLIEAACQICCR